METQDTFLQTEYEQQTIFDVWPELGSIEDYLEEPAEAGLVPVFAPGQELEGEEVLLDLLDRKSINEGQDQLFGWPIEDESE